LLVRLVLRRKHTRSICSRRFGGLGPCRCSGSLRGGFLLLLSLHGLPLFAGAFSGGYACVNLLLAKFILCTHVRDGAQRRTSKLGCFQPLCGALRVGAASEPLLGSIGGDCRVLLALVVYLLGVVCVSAVFQPARLVKLG
jgi:hypothetical protein